MQQKVLTVIKNLSMRERKRDKGRLLDIIEHSSNVTMLIEGYTYDKFMVDKRTYYSVMKNVEVVGEAAFMLTKAFKEAHPATPWNSCSGYAPRFSP